MFSQRGVLNLGHTLQDMRDIQRRVNANRLNGIDGEVLDARQVQEIVPIMDCSANRRYPVMGASWQPRGGVARHDAVAWGFARAADRLGVDLIQQCEVVDIQVEDGAATAVVTKQHGTIKADRIGCVVAGNSGVLARMAGFRLPLESHPLQALVSEPIKPVLDTVVMSNHVHGYISQADKGDLVIGAGIDGYNGYGQRGSYPTIEHTVQAIVELFPIFSGAVLWIPVRMPVPSSPRRRWRTCSSTAVGAPAASRRPRVRGMCSPPPWPGARRMNWPSPSPCIASTTVH
jgi:sarcosine oxidase subunit beta